jgi:hypothetical protein
MLDAIPHALAGLDLVRAIRPIESAGLTVVLNQQSPSQMAQEIANVTPK